jgi:hypothetical protein
MTKWFLWEIEGLHKIEAGYSNHGRVQDSMPADAMSCEGSDPLPCPTTTEKGLRTNKVFCMSPEGMTTRKAL